MSNTGQPNFSNRLASEENGKTTQERDPFFYKDAIDPLSYDWKADFGRLAAQMRTNKHPFVSFEVCKSMGLIKYCRDLEVKAESQEKELKALTSELTTLKASQGASDSSVVEGQAKTISVQADKIKKLSSDVESLENVVVNLKSELVEKDEKISQLEETLTPQQKGAITKKDNKSKGGK